MFLFTAVSQNLYLAFELICFFSFAVIIFREIYQKNTARVLEIVSCAAFGMILEIGNTYLSHAYYYSQDFLISFFNVPLAIGFAWAVIIYCAMLLSDQYNIPWGLRPFMDAFTAVILDLAMDPVAIRLGFWHWSIPLDQEWYGVPFENLVGWIFVVLSFSFIIRYLRTLNFKRAVSKLLFVISPLLSYGGLILGLTIFSFIAVLPYGINNWATFLSFNYHPDLSILYNSQVQLWKLIVLLIIFVELVNLVAWSLFRYRQNYTRRFDLLSFSILSGFYIFFFVALFVSGIASQMPVLVFLSLSIFLVHLLIHLLPYILNPSVIYVFKKVSRSILAEEEVLEKIINNSVK
ncbi:MAG: carotenoid biosynthesis protein [Patescibacteria group bacterium]|nr:carotenoid biosynthesis protein [Patescibacteria group bacterium]